MANRWHSVLLGGGLFILLALLGILQFFLPPAALARPKDLAAAIGCAPLFPATGAIIQVDTVAELQNAVGNLASNTTILIADGTYNLTQTLVIDGGVQNIALRGASGSRDQVVIRGRGMSNSSYGSVPHGILLRDANQVLIADLTIRDAYFHNIQIQGEHGPQGVQLYNLHLLDAGEQIVKGSTAGPPGPYADNGLLACSLLEYTDRARSWYTNAIDVLGGANWVVRDNVFRRIRAPIGQLAGPAVLFWRNSQGTVVERNQFIDCDRAIAFGLSTPDANSREGEKVYDHQGGVIRNNFIVQSPGSPTADVGITVNHARDYKIYHNTILLNDAFPWTIEYRFAASSGEITNNLTDGPIQQRNGAVGTLAGNVTSALPSWFVDAAGADLHLRPTALLAIDRAVPLPAVGDDVDGQSRPQGFAGDVGADEATSPPFIPTEWHYLPLIRH